MAGAFKVGDEVILRADRKGEVLVIEQVFLRGLTPQYLCSFKNKGWMPVFYSRDYIELAKDKAP